MIPIIRIAGDSGHQPIPNSRMSSGHVAVMHGE